MLLTRFLARVKHRLLFSASHCSPDDTIKKVGESSGVEGSSQSKLKCFRLGFTLSLSRADREWGRHRSADERRSALIAADPAVVMWNPVKLKRHITWGDIKAAGQPHWRWLSWKTVVMLASPRIAPWARVSTRWDYLEGKYCCEIDKIK